MTRFTIAAAAAAVALTACSSTVAAPKTDVTPTETAQPSEPATPEPTEDEEPAAPPAAQLSDVELAEFQVNEVGRVPVIMWHDVLSSSDSAWNVTWETFTAQVRRLYDAGYRPVTTTELATGEFDIPAGTTPVLLTFDDSYQSHMAFGADGEVDPKTAAGFLYEFSKEHPDWRATGVFYLYWPVPFRENGDDIIAKKFHWLIDTGFELGQHSHTHDDLSKLSNEKVMESLLANQARTREVLGDDTFKYTSIALPFGIWPKDKDLAVAGGGCIPETGNCEYEHDIVLEVGWMPDVSPHHVEWDPHSVMRVHTSTEEFGKWLDWLDADELRRYRSDGDPATVTVPAGFADQVRDGVEAVRTYTPAAG